MHLDGSGDRRREGDFIALATQQRIVRRNRTACRNQHDGTGIGVQTDVLYGGDGRRKNHNEQHLRHRNGCERHPRPQNARRRLAKRRKRSDDGAGNHQTLVECRRERPHRPRLWTRPGQVCGRTAAHWRHGRLTHSHSRLPRAAHSLQTRQSRPLVWNNPPLDEHRLRNTGAAHLDFDLL